MKLYAIIPVFNEETNLPRCLSHLSKYVDGILALDDGSTDKSFEILKGYSKVREILKNKPSLKRVWNDGLNHIRLNEALKQYKPDWIIRIDADETFENNIINFLPTLMAIKENIKAFAFCRHLFSEGELKCSKETHATVRMYRYNARSKFINRRLHCNFIPIDVKASEVLLTNIRLWHHASINAEQCLKRYGKFTEADPYNLYQDDYSNLLQPSEMVDVIDTARDLALQPFIGKTFYTTNIVYQQIFQTVDIGLKYLLWPIRKRLK